VRLDSLHPLVDFSQKRGMMCGNEQRKSGASSALLIGTTMLSALSFSLAGQSQVYFRGQNRTRNVHESRRFFHRLSHCIPTAGKRPDAESIDLWANCPYISTMFLQEHFVKKRIPLVSTPDECVRDSTFFSRSKSPLLDKAAQNWGTREPSYNRTRYVRRES